MKKCLLVLSGIALTAGMLFAQPSNDNCAGALPMNYADTEAEVVLVSGDTRGATISSQLNSCSVTWTDDDVWFIVTTPGVLPADGITIKTYYDATNPDDVAEATGIAFYMSCDDNVNPIGCVNSNIPADSHLEIPTACILPNTTYYVRVWATNIGPDFSGTFRIGAFAFVNTDVVLWKETFATGLLGWVTFGTCGGNPDSNMNALWKYVPDGILDLGAYATPPGGVGVAGPTLCNGAVGVDSDYDDTNGVEGAFGTGRCPTGGGSQYVLVSPAFAHSQWAASGISITWTQGLREYLSTYFVGYRIFQGGVWTDWRSYEVNTEFAQNSAHFNNDVQRVFLGGANEGDSLQLRFVYNANYYYWGIDDVCLIQAPCVDLRSMSNFFAIAPAASTPVSQIKPWYPLNDIYNAGGCTQSNVNLNFTVMNSGGMEVYNQNLAYGEIPPDSLSENQNFGMPVVVPNKAPDTYEGLYTLTSDASNPDDDYDFSDNTNMVAFNTTNDLYALETGFTRSLAPAASNYDAAAPFGYVYGNYFYFPNGSDAKGDPIKLRSVTWGAANPADLAGAPINLILFKWVDANENEIAEASEREIIGFAVIEFDGTEADNSIFETILESFSGDEILFEDNTAYLMVMEYAAQDQTSFFVLASDALDYSAVQLSASQAGVPTYSAVLGLEMDGNVADIDYAVTSTFGAMNNIVPLMRLNLDVGTAVKQTLPEENIVKLYPNPVSDQVKLDLEFTQQMEQVEVRMTDVSGKTVHSELYHNMEQASLQYNVEKLTPGAYTLQVSTEKGSRAVPFVVQR